MPKTNWRRRCVFRPAMHWGSYCERSAIGKGEIQKVRSLTVRTDEKWGPSLGEGGVYPVNLQMSQKRDNHECDVFGGRGLLIIGGGWCRGWPLPDNE